MAENLIGKTNVNVNPVSGLLADICPFLQQIRGRVDTLKLAQMAAGTAEM
ncbi:hypothetical protein [Chitinophaga sp.]